MGYGRGGNSGGRGKQEYDNELRGVLFKNEQRRNDKDPNYQGQAQVQGVEYWVSAWINEDNKGNKRINFNLTEKEQRRGGQGYNRQNARGSQRQRDDDFDDHDRKRGNQRRAGPPDDDMDDDVPF